MIDMTPQPDEYSIKIPITLDYRQTRSGEAKFKVIGSLVVFALLVISAIVLIKLGLPLWKGLLIFAGIFYVLLLFTRFVIFKELYFSDIYESQKAEDFQLHEDSIWQIFDIDQQYPYVCYFNNGQKGIFVRLERNTIVGRPETAMYDHYEHISNALNTAHSLNMSITHIDYMDNIGKDERIIQLYDQVKSVHNPEMQAMLVDIYDNLMSELSYSFSNYDVYLFRTKEQSQNLLHNVQLVLNTMLGENFITYKILNRAEIGNLCVAIFNLHTFNMTEASNRVLGNTETSDIVPIAIYRADGQVEKLNKTIEEKKFERKERERKEQEAKELRKRKKRKKKIQVEEPEFTDSGLDIFDSDQDLSPTVEDSMSQDQIFTSGSEDSTSEDQSQDISSDFDIFE